MYFIKDIADCRFIEIDIGKYPTTHIILAADNNYIGPQYYGMVYEKSELKILAEYNYKDALKLSHYRSIQK